MSTIPKQSRQQRALAQRTEEAARYNTGRPLPQNGTLRNLTTPEDKAAKAQRDIDSLRTSLGIHTAESSD